MHVETKGHDEVPLPGGRITKGVVRKGNFVLRPCCSNSNFVHDVLKWLESKDVSTSPRFIGFADDGREIISFLEGISPDDIGCFSDNQLFEAGKIIKKLHSALSDFPGCQNGQTVCHNDLSPCNFMFKNELPYSVFDWDAAAIGDPINDIAYAAWMWCDIGNSENDPNDVGRKIKVILDAYGFCIVQRNSLIAKVHEQMQRVAESLLRFKEGESYQWVMNCARWLYKHQEHINLLF